MGSPKPECRQRYKAWRWKVRLRSHQWSEYQQNLMPCNSYAKNISRQRNRLAMVSAASRKIEHWTYEMGKLIFKRSIKVESQGDNLIIKDCTDRYGANLATKSVTHWSPGWLCLPGLPHHSVFPFQPECSVREDKISCRKRGLSLGKDPFLLKWIWEESWEEELPKQCPSLEKVYERDRQVKPLDFKETTGNSVSHQIIRQCVWW